MKAFKLDFSTQYNQFYITSDKGNAALFDGLNWSDESYNDRLAAFENFLVVYPESYGHVNGELLILNSADETSDFTTYDHVVEGGLNVGSGSLQILDCPNSATELEVQLEPGLYRVRIYFSNMAGYDSDEKESDDKCRIEIWPGNDFQINVLKRFPRNF
ncbi:MAG: hypothetical protein V4520_12560 [Bacteroidota bacterium]